MTKTQVKRIFILAVILLLKAVDTSTQPTQSENPGDAADDDDDGDFHPGPLCAVTVCINKKVEWLNCIWHCKVVKQREWGRCVVAQQKLCDKCEEKEDNKADTCFQCQCLGAFLGSDIASIELVSPTTASVATFSPDFDTLTSSINTIISTTAGPSIDSTKIDTTTITPGFDALASTVDMTTSVVDTGISYGVDMITPSIEEIVFTGDTHTCTQSIDITSTIQPSVSTSPAEEEEADDDEEDEEKQMPKSLCERVECKGDKGTLLVWLDCLDYCRRKYGPLTWGKCEEHKQDLCENCQDISVSCFKCRCIGANVKNESSSSIDVSISTVEPTIVSTVASIPNTDMLTSSMDGILSSVTTVIPSVNPTRTCATTITPEFSPLTSSIDVISDGMDTITPKTESTMTSTVTITPGLDRHTSSIDLITSSMDASITFGVDTETPGVEEQTSTVQTDTQYVQVTTSSNVFTFSIDTTPPGTGVTPSG